MYLIYIILSKLIFAIFLEQTSFWMKSSRNILYNRSSFAISKMYNLIYLVSTFIFQKTGKRGKIAMNRYNHCKIISPSRPRNIDPMRTSVSQCHGQRFPNLLVEVSPRLTRNDKHRCDSTRLFIIPGLRNEKARAHFLHRLLASRVTIRGSPPRENQTACAPANGAWRVIYFVSLLRICLRCSNDGSLRNRSRDVSLRACKPSLCGSTNTRWVLCVCVCVCVEQRRWFLQKKKNKIK